MTARWIINAIDTCLLILKQGILSPRFRHFHIGWCHNIFWRAPTLKSRYYHRHEDIAGSCRFYWMHKMATLFATFRYLSWPAHARKRAVSHLYRAATGFAAAASIIAPMSRYQKLYWRYIISHVMSWAPAFQPIASARQLDDFTEHCSEAKPPWNWRPEPTAITISYLRLYWNNSRHYEINAARIYIELKISCKCDIAEACKQTYAPYLRVISVLKFD